MVCSIGCFSSMPYEPCREKLICNFWYTLFKLWKSFMLRLKKKYATQQCICLNLYEHYTVVKFKITFHFLATRGKILHVAFRYINQRITWYQTTVWYFAFIHHFVPVRCFVSSIWLCAWQDDYEIREYITLAHSITHLGCHICKIVCTYN